MKEFQKHGLMLLYAVTNGSSLFTLSPVMGLIRLDLGIGFTQAGILFAVPPAMITVLAFVGGVLGDKFGIRRVSALAIIILSLGLVWRGFPSDYLNLVFATVLVGVGLAFLFPSQSMIIGSAYPSKSKGLATGIYMSGSFLGTISVLVLSVPVLFPLFGTWKLVLLFWGLVAITFSTAAWFGFRSKRIGGEAGDGKRPIRTGEYRWRSKAVWTSAGISLLANVMFWSLTSWLPIILNEKGAPIAEAGILSTALLVFSIPALLIAPWVSDKIGVRKPVLWFASIASLLGTLTLSQVSLDLLSVPLAVVGAGVSLMLVWGVILPLELARPAELGRAAGLVLAVGHLGATTGPWVSGFIRDVSGTFTVVIVTLVAFALASVILAATIPETGTRRTRDPEKTM